MKCESCEEKEATKIATTPNGVGIKMLQCDECALWFLQDAEIILWHGGRGKIEPIKETL